MYIPEELNEVQKRAVLDTDGAVLVTAGAGSGKTRLLTHRIAHLIKDCGVSPYNILAITFTNKAANEMKNRLSDMLDTEGIWIFTFHAACVRMLRLFADEIGFSKNFTIYGETETKSVVKRICKELDEDNGDDMIKPVLSAISKAKNDGVAPEDYEAVFKFDHDAEFIAKAYAGYQRALRLNNALDYDDLLIETLKMLKSSKRAREYLQDKFRYIHIDEFQDTNVVQYNIVKILAQKYGNIFAVGDEDQCIYTWRGASIANIFDFQRDFAGCKVYKLEQNYRSTNEILEVANRVIKINEKRLDKKLWTANGSGAPVVCHAADTEGFEADFVVKKIFELTHDGDFNYSDCAVLMRLNALSRPFEERFLQYGIPHKVYGGFKFYERKEVKDALAYARIAVNTRDDEAAYRVINFPRRGIGEASIEKMRDYAGSSGKSVYEMVTDPESAPFAGALKTKLAEFGKTLKSLVEAADGDVSVFFNYLIYDVLKAGEMFSQNDDDRAKLENLNELINSVKDFVKNNPSAKLEDYLQMISLYSDTDDMNDDNAVTVATVHSAKGLEFPVVFVVGLEDGIFPSIRMGESIAGRMEEERRLMYVAITRAKKRLFMTYAKSRFLYGDTRYSIPSRFLSECGLVAKRETPLRAPNAYGHDYGRKREGGYERADGYGYDSSEVTFGGKFEGKYKSDFAKKAEPVAAAGKQELKAGDRITHRRLGNGTVLSIEKMGDNTYAKIDFERGGVMLLAVDFAPITVIGGNG